MQDCSSESPIKVAVCLCPLAAGEENDKRIISTSGNEVKVCMGEGKGQKSYEFHFPPFSFDDRSSERSASIEQVSDVIEKDVLEKSFKGFNMTVFTYGSPNTGKSALMYGYKNETGIIKKVIKSIFRCADDYDNDTSFRCEISFFEICGEMITDLVSKRGQIKSQEGVPKIKVKEDATKGIYVDKLSRHIVTDLDEALALYSKGVKNKNRLAALDPDSKGTSHSIFTLVFTQAFLKDGLPMELVSKVSLIDLASRDGYTGHLNGIDKVISYGDENGNLEMTLEKAGPLEALTDVIKSLAAQSYPSTVSYASMMSSSPIPFHDTSLTLLMKDALGGNSETIMLCCISPAERYLRNTLSSLKYANLVQQIRNYPCINEDQNVKLIRTLKDEIEQLKTSQNKSTEGKRKSDLKKLQRDQELVNRLTGIWEEKWSKAQKMIEDKSLDVKDLGTGLKLETKEPHFVSLGGGRLSVGVSIIPIQKGFTRVGCGGEGFEVDLHLTGKGIASEHCLIEYDGEAVVLHPKNELISVDGIPISEPTRLPQGCMICIGQCNYFRFNHPEEAAQMKEHLKNSRFSIVPDGIYPDVQLAIEQRRIEMQERETLRAENKRLLAMEQQYMQSLDKLEFEKDQLEHEKIKLQILQQQQQNAANQFDRKVSIQIEELKLQKQELHNFQIEREKLLAKEKEIERQASQLNEARRAKEMKQKSERDRILSVQASLDLQEFEALEASLNNSNSNSPLLRHNMITKQAAELEDDKHRLAMLELDLLTDDLEYHDQFQVQKEELDKERRRLEIMEEQHKQLEKDLSEQISRLQQERHVELSNIEQELEKLRQLEQEQTRAIDLIEIEREKLLSAKENEKEKIEKESEMLAKIESDRIRLLEKAADEQQREREMINREKMRLLGLEEEHKKALENLQLDMITQQEKLERERKLEQDYIDTEQLMLEELEQRQFESARQIEYETQLIQSQVEKEKQDALRRNAENEYYIKRLREEQESALRQAEEERRKIQRKREEEQEQLQKERENLKRMENDYKQFMSKIEVEKEELIKQIYREKDEEIQRMKKEFEMNLLVTSSPNTSLSSEHDGPSLLTEIEEERTRLTELKRQAEEKAELQWKEKRNDSDRREIEERELESQKEKLEQLKREQELKAEAELKIIQEETAKMKKQEVQLKQREQELAELHIERERREELERLLKSGKENESILVRTLDEEKRKLSTLEKSLSEEKSRRLEIEKRLQDEEMKNKLNDDKRKAPDSRSNGAPSMNGTLKRRIPSYTFSLRSGQSSGNSDDINLLHHIAAAGHVIENCPAVKINRYSCRGFLQKMGKSRLSVSQWKRRWFVFDRKLRALCYYQDERKTKSKGILYFQSIQDVFVDASIKKSPNPKTTFCVRTPQRTFVLNAPSPTAMSIWIDVIFTGMEGNFMSMTL